MLFRFMVDSNEEIAQDQSANRPGAGPPRGPTYCPPVVEDSEYLAGYHKLE